MKKLHLLLGALLLGTLGLHADPFTPGGVAVDWSKYDPKPEKAATTINLLKNGSFEMPGTDLSGWRGKGHWVGWAHVHTAQKTPELQNFRTRFSRTAFRKVVQGGSDGKFSAYIKTPDPVKDMIKPLPMLSNKISQTIPLKPEKSERVYTLTFMAKGMITATRPHSGSLVIQMRGQKLNAKKRFQGVGKGVQNSFTLRSSWTRHTVNLTLPPNSDGLSVTLILYGVGEAYFDDARLFPADSARKAADRIKVRVSPYSQLDNTYCFGEKLPGVMNFTFSAERKAFKRKKLHLELTLPQGFKVVDAREKCKVSKGENNVWRIDLMGMGAVAFTRAYYMLQACSVMVESTLPASEKRYTATYRLVDGDWKGTLHKIDLKVIPAFHGKRPQLFRSSAMLGHEFTYEGAGTAKAVYFYDKSGFSCIHGAKDALAKEIKKLGILRYRSDYFLCNGFRLGAAPKTGNARFMLADGTHFKRKICPIEVYKRGPYYMEEIYGKILKKAIVDNDTVDIFMTNWEPYYLDSKGCFCVNCRDEFIKHSKGKISKEEIMAVWPRELLRKYAEEYFKFRSWQHGQLVITLHKDAAKLGKSVKKESGFVPEISWRSATHAGNSYCKQYNVKDYMYELPWLEPWGPYIYNRAGLPYNYYPTAHLPTYGAAGVMKEFIIDSFKNKKAPGMIAFPHGHQGEDWVTEAEAFAFEMLCFFVRGWEGAFGYYFPRGYDYRHWRAAAEANTAIARYENFTFKGKNDNKGVKITSLSPLPEKLYYAPHWQEPEGEVGLVPGLNKLGAIQFQTWRYNGEMLICVGNFWQKGENFFKLQIAGLVPAKKYGVEVSGHGFGNYTGKELARGITLQCGALRWQFIKIGKAVKVGKYTEKAVKSAFKKRLGAIKKAVAWEKAYYEKISSYSAADTPLIDYKALKSVSSQGVTVSAADKNLLVKTPVYTLRVDPGQGGRIHDWKAGKTLLFPRSKILGFAVPGVWYPAKSAIQLKTGMKLEKLVPAAKGVELHLSRILTNKDNRQLAGVRIDMIYRFEKDKVVTTARVTNLLHDAIELAFRFHNMPALLGTQKRDSGKVQFASGETFLRDFDQKIVRVSETDPLLEQAFKIIKQHRTAKNLPVRLTAPWSNKTLEFTFPATPHSIVIWDDARQEFPTFEPIFKRTQIAPGQSAEFTMSAAIK